MATRKKLVKDDAANVIQGAGSEMFTYRFTSVTDPGTDIDLGIDVKRILIHIEGSNQIASITGQATGSAAAYLTSDGITLDDVEIAALSTDTICTVTDLTGATLNVSVIAWR